MARTLIALVMLLIAAPGSAQEDLKSGNAMLPHCKRALSYIPPDSGADVPLALCLGAVMGIASTADRLPPEARFCPPPSVTPDQLVRVVVQYLEAHPARLHENFFQLAYQAMHAAWPCN